MENFQESSFKKIHRAPSRFYCTYLLKKFPKCKVQIPIIKTGFSMVGYIIHKVVCLRVVIPKKAVTTKKRHNPDKKSCLALSSFLLSLSPQKMDISKKVARQAFWSSEPLTWGSPCDIKNDAAKLWRFFGNNQSTEFPKNFMKKQLSALRKKVK